MWPVDPVESLWAALFFFFFFFFFFCYSPPPDRFQIIQPGFACIYSSSVTEVVGVVRLFVHTRVCINCDYTLEGPSKATTLVTPQYVVCSCAISINPSVLTSCPCVILTIGYWTRAFALLHRTQWHLASAIVFAAACRYMC